MARSRVSPINNNGSIQFKFTYQGKRYSFNPVARGSYDDKRAMSKALAIAAQIELDILGEDFDYSLERYRYKSTPAQPKPTRVIEVWDTYVKSLDLTERTKNGHYAQVRRMIVKSNPTIVESGDWIRAIDGISADTWNDRLGFLRACFRWAVRRGLVTVNPFDDIRGRKATKNRIEVFTQSEIRAILEALRTDRFKPQASVFSHSHYADFVEYLFLTGCRPSEAIGLRVRDVDLDRGHIVIGSVLARGDNGQTNPSARVRKDTKTGNTRYLPLNQNLIRLLKLLCEGKLQNDLIFVSPSGLAIDDRMLGQRVWKRVLAGLGLEYRRLYITRHTFASIALEQGVPIATVAYLLGHSDLSMVTRTYGHLVSKPVMPEIL